MLHIDVGLGRDARSLSVTLSEAKTVSELKHALERYGKICHTVNQQSCPEFLILARDTGIGILSICLATL